MNRSRWASPRWSLPTQTVPPGSKATDWGLWFAIQVTSRGSLVRSNSSGGTTHDGTPRAPCRSRTKQLLPLSTSSSTGLGRLHGDKDTEFGSNVHAHRTLLRLGVGYEAQLGGGAPVHLIAAP